MDGGLFDNVPSDIMRGFCGGGKVIAVDVSAPHELSPIPDYGIQLSGWTYLRNLFRRRGRRVRYPNLLQVLVRSMEFGGVANRHLLNGLSDLTLRLPLQEFNRLDFWRAGEMAEVAYRYAKRGLREWRSRETGENARSGSAAASEGDGRLGGA